MRRALSAHGLQAPSPKTSQPTKKKKKMKKDEKTTMLKLNENHKRKVKKVLSGQTTDRLLSAKTRGKKAELVKEKSGFPLRLGMVI